MIELSWPWCLGFLPLPLLAYFLLPRARQADAALHVPFYNAVSNFVSVRATDHRTTITRLLLAAMWLLLVLASARPVWIGDPIQLPASGRDLMVAVDISGSMGQNDMTLAGVSVTRLDAVKKIAGDFIEQRAGDRLGLILFGSKPYEQTPLTFDRHTVGALLDETPLGIAGGKTAIGDAIGLAVKRLRARPSEQRVLILLTDGRNNFGELTPMQAADIASTESVRIYTIAFGAERMVIPGLIMDRMINPSAELDTETLAEIAGKTGGLYRRARSTEELAAIYAELDQVEPIELAFETFRPQKSLYIWPLSMALFISLVVAILQPRVIGMRLPSLANLKPRSQGAVTSA
ncbi:MAG: BatB protein [OM182 bacterium MED-G24]|uniref:BatB protein n=1 Tax=OM182 bacterium MED-G24 TaxID=1986255 RepID=A0A2A5WJI3_9GAMM|nr:MAG: BatB protein [OM182 bacterium MED-G24]|tara:strand:+ start:29246 stop:30289 length:1044 start_codon:yes stop_codon:yes gene_type:complete